MSFGSTDSSSDAPRCHTAGDYEHAEVAVFVGKNPWQSHGFPRARAVLRAIASDENRALIVIDPRRTQTAELADYHIQVRPGGDAHCLTALLAALIQENLTDSDFIERHTRGFEDLTRHLQTVSVADYCARAGVPEAQIREVARRIAAAKSVSIFEDLGIQQAPHSTLCSYLEKLIYVLTGNFAKEGGMNIHTRFASLGGGGKGGTRVSPVGGHRIISGLIPANVIPDEILTDHPDRFRAMIVESTNPAHSLADSRRMREALDALDTLVVIDIAMTETARHADYILPAASQYEKWEATFFTLEFPHNDFQLRAPILEPLPGTMIEPEMHSRLVRALGGLDEADLAPLRAAADKSWTAFGEAFLAAAAATPMLGKLAPVVLYETLGRTLPDGAQAAAALWGAAQSCAMSFPESVRRAGFEGEGMELGNALFAAILRERSGIIFTVDEYEDTWRRVETPDGRINLIVGELMDEFVGLAGEDPATRNPEFPFVLSAGERRTSTANTIYRDPAWRKKREIGSALRMNPGDAERLGIDAGGRARITTKRGSMETVVELTDTLQAGHVSLPNGLGLSYPNENGERLIEGIPPNELTAGEDRDWLGRHAASQACSRPRRGGVGGSVGPRSWSYAPHGARIERRAVRVRWNDSRAVVLVAARSASEDLRPPVEAVPIDDASDTDIPVAAENVVPMSRAAHPRVHDGRWCWLSESDVLRERRPLVARLVDDADPSVVRQLALVGLVDRSGAGGPLKLGV